MGVDYGYYNPLSGEFFRSEPHHYMPGTEADAERIIRDKLNQAIALERLVGTTKR